MKPKVVLSLVIALFLLCVGRPALAGPVISFTNPTVDFDNFTDLVGWQFTANSGFTVTQLGFYDHPANGATTLTVDHPVGIFDLATQALVVSAVVKPSDLYGNFFNWTSVAPTTLTAGHTYQIVTLLGPDNRTWNPDGFTVSSLISYEQNVAENGIHVLAIIPGPPEQDGIPNGFFGPNMCTGSSPCGTTALAVPEPGTLSLMLVGVGMMALTRRRKKSV